MIRNMSEAPRQATASQVRGTNLDKPFDFWPVQTEPAAERTTCPYLCFCVGDRLLAGNGGKVAVYSIGQARQGGIFACEESPSILCRSTSLGLTAIFSNDSTTPRGYQPSKTWHRDNYSRISASNAIIPRGSPEVAAFVFKSLLINVSKVESLVSRSDDIKKYIKGMFSRLNGRGEMARFRFCDLCRATACFEQV
ncbi:hypothetical protein CI102_12438 [Trichoderma harzianum]|nr:hypothetical protein CI102_12438 [Trichoderma harzianum]